MSEATLKPCPFCGATVALVTPLRVICPKCGEQHPAREWNTRPIEDSQAAEIERLRERAFALDCVLDAFPETRKYVRHILASTDKPKAEER